MEETEYLLNISTKKKHKGRTNNTRGSSSHMITVISPGVNTVHWSFIQNACNARVNEYMDQVAMLRVQIGLIRLDGN